MQMTKKNVDQKGKLLIKGVIMTSSMNEITKTSVY